MATIVINADPGWHALMSIMITMPSLNNDNVDIFVGSIHSLENVSSSIYTLRSNFMTFWSPTQIVLIFIYMMYTLAKNF